MNGQEKIQNALNEIIEGKHNCIELLRRSRIAGRLVVELHDYGVVTRCSYGGGTLYKIKAEDVRVWTKDNGDVVIGNKKGGVFCVMGTEEPKILGKY